MEVTEPQGERREAEAKKRKGEKAKQPPLYLVGYPMIKLYVLKIYMQNTIPPYRDGNNYRNGKCYGKMVKAGKNGLKF